MCFFKLFAIGGKPQKKKRTLFSSAFFSLCLVHHFQTLRLLVMSRQKKDVSLDEFELQLPPSGYKILHTIDAVLEPFPVSFKVRSYSIIS